MVPTGEQYEIRHGDQVAVVVQVGGGLRSYDVAGRAVCDGYAADVRPDGGRGQVLAPWPNRVRDGRYTFDGREQQLPLSEPALLNASHGLVRWAEWTPLERSADAVTVGVRVWPQPGYPFRLDLSAHYALDDEGLSVTIVGRNGGDVPLPYGIGQHPYVTAGPGGTGLVDECLLTVPAATWFSTDDRNLPVAAADVAGTAYDFRVSRPIGDLVLDTPYADLDKADDGRAVVRLEDPDGSRGVEVWFGEGVEYTQVFSGDTLAPERQRRGLAVEPMSCPPDAFNSGLGLVTLEPGQSHTLQWGLSAF